MFNLWVGVKKEHNGMLYLDIRMEVFNDGT